MTDREGDAGRPAQQDWTLQSLFDDLELALHGKTGNTWELHQADRVRRFLMKIQAALEAERAKREAAEQRGRDTKPCSHCQWPKPMNDDYHICPCCGFEPGYDDSMVGPYQWDGTWWAKDERKPELVRRLEARCEALQAQLAVPPAVNKRAAFKAGFMAHPEAEAPTFTWSFESETCIAADREESAWQAWTATQPPGDPPVGDRR